MSDQSGDQRHGPAFHPKGSLDGSRQSRRTFSETDPNAKGFVDPVDQAIKLRAAFVTLLGLVVGGVAGARAVSSYELPVWLIPVFAIAGGVV